MTLRAPYAPLATLLFTLASVAFGQQADSSAPGQPYTLQVNTRNVVLDVVVTDKKGGAVNYARILDRDDFTVYEDKVPQTILSLNHTNAELKPTNVPVGSTAELDRKEPNAPVSILVLDEITTRFEDEAFARYSLKRYLNTQGDTLLQPTMLIAVNLDKFLVLRDYTTSKKEVLSALDHHLAGNPWRAQNGGWKGEMFNAAFSSLIQVAQATAGHPGHKNMIWIGRGFPGIDPMTLDPDTADQLEKAIQTCTNLLRDSRVTLYTVDPAGLSAAPPSQDEDGFDEDDPFETTISFGAMAKATGGRSFFNRNDVDHMIDTSVQSGANFYTLSYRPSSAGDAEKLFRNIKVVMKDPNLRATTREGYYATTPPMPPSRSADGKLSRQLPFDLATAEGSTMVYDAVPMTIERDPKDPGKLLIHLDSTDFPWQMSADGKPTVELSMLVASFDKKGKTLSQTARMITLRDDNPAGAHMLDLTNTISVLPTTARIRAVVRLSGNGRIGASNLNVDGK